MTSFAQFDQKKERNEFTIREEETVTSMTESNVQRI